MTGNALITGITGQDGSFLAEQLLDMGYEVFGLVRRLSSPNTTNLENIQDLVTFIEGDMTDSHSINKAIIQAEPDEIYNLAAQSFVGTSWTQPELTANITGLGVTRILNAMKEEAPDARLFQASSSEMYGKVQTMPQNEDTPFYPRSPYGIAKLYGYWMVKNYRESYGLHVSNGIMFNHESERRGIEFVTRKIVDGAVRCYLDIDTELRLGNLDAKRDWGYAPDYMDAAWRILQQDEPSDFVISTGSTHTVREFCDIAFSLLDLDYRNYVIIDRDFYRPAEVDVLIGDATRIEDKLDWKPTTSFKTMIDIMVENDLCKYGAIGSE